MATITLKLVRGVGKFSADDRPTSFTLTGENRSGVTAIRFYNIDSVLIHTITNVTFDVQYSIFSANPSIEGVSEVIIPEAIYKIEIDSDDIVPYVIIRDITFYLKVVEENALVLKEEYLEENIYTRIDDSLLNIKDAYPLFGIQYFGQQNAYGIINNPVCVKLREAP